MGRIARLLSYRFSQGGKRRRQTALKNGPAGA